MRGQHPSDTQLYVVPTACTCLTGRSRCGVGQGTSYTFDVYANSDVVGEAVFQSSIQEFTQCSNRGVCEPLTGECACGTGYSTFGHGACAFDDDGRVVVAGGWSPDEDEGLISKIRSAFR